METGGEDSEWIDDVGDERKGLQMSGGGTEGIAGVESEVGAEEFVLEGKDVEEDEEEDDGSADALEQVEPVSGEGVVDDVWLAGEGDPDAIDGVEEQGEEDECPLENREEGQIVYFVDLDLVDVSLEDGGVYEKMDEQISPEEDAGEGMETSQEEMTPPAEGHHGLIRRGCCGHSVPFEEGRNAGL